MSASQTALLTAIARERGLAISGGTDYHGTNQPGIRLGCGQGDMAIPDDIYLALLDKHRRRGTVSQTRSPSP